MLHSLGRNIVLGTVEPGTALDPIALGEQFGVSRTVVREVFRALGSKGLVDARPRRGTTVSARSRWQMLDGDVLRWRFSHGADVRFLDQVFDLRLAVEPLAARRAATEHVEADLAGLTEALRAMRSAASPEEAHRGGPVVPPGGAQGGAQRTARVAGATGRGRAAGA